MVDNRKSCVTWNAPAEFTCDCKPNECHDKLKSDKNLLESCEEMYSWMSDHCKGSNFEPMLYRAKLCIAESRTFQKEENN